MQEKVVLAFDIGIRNLAWCLMEKSDISGTKIQILGWENYDLLAGQNATEKTSARTCKSCSKTANYESGSDIFCVFHCPSNRPAFRDLSGNLVKKLPSAPQLRNILLSRGVKNPPKTKGELLKKISEIFSLPILKIKEKNATKTDISVIHDSIRKFISERNELFSLSTEILLENQPVLKNPTMKTVQILLFATLRDLLFPKTPTVKFVHAKKKVEGKEKGDKGYKDRKKGSEDRVMAMLKSNKITQSGKWEALIQKHTKKNDLTDAFCMCLDFLGIQ